MIIVHSGELSAIVPARLHINYLLAFPRDIPDTVRDREGAVEKNGYQQELQNDPEHKRQDEPAKKEVQA